jgi:hypothetical protein
MRESESQLAVSRSIPQPKLTAAVFTAVSVLITILWQALPGAIPFRQWDMWVWFVCCGVVLLSVARFSIRHSAPLPEVWLLSFPFLFEFFFQKICPTTKVASVDELLWAFDARFGYPQVALSKLLISAPLLFWLCKLVWWSLPLLFVVLYLLLPEPVRRKYMVALVCTGCIILPLYALCPGAGPIYLFRERFLGPLPVLLHPQRSFLPAGLILNTTPSGHMAWALLLFWFAWKYCRKHAAVIFGALLFLTVLSTLGLGEHYLIDLIVSFPYAAAIWALVEKQWQRAGALLAIVIAWLLVLREGWAIPTPAPVVWLLCVVTILCSLPWRELRPTPYASN